MADNFLNSTGLAYFWSKIKAWVDSKLATEATYGMVKTNPTAGITLNTDGALEVDGRLGEQQGALYYPTTAAPSQLAGYTLLLTDVVGMSSGGRTFAIHGGNNIQLTKSHAAGTTEYHVANNYSNRIAAMAYKDGYATFNNDTAGQFSVKIKSVNFANGDPVTPYSGVNSDHGDIIFTTASSANPDAATNKIRCYGSTVTTDVLAIGQCNGASGGKVLAVGMALRAEGNQVFLFGNGCYSNANNSVTVGRMNINKQQSSLVAGEGNDTSNGTKGVGVIGLYADVSSDTLFAVGNGTSDTARSNAFEVLADGVVLKSPNGTRYKVSVADDGTLTTTAL